MILPHLAVVLAAVSFTSTSVVQPPSIKADDGNFELLILHNNDMHARFEQTSQYSGTCTTEDRDAGKCYGGFPRVAHVVKEARRAAAANEGPPVLYLNAGDTYTGSTWFTIYKWKIAAEFINALEPDAVSMGNNELTSESNQLSPFLENLETKILATNVIVKGKEDKLHKSLIFNINDVKVGLVAYLTLETSALDSVGDIEYIDEIIALKEEILKLQEQNVNIIIALGHSTLEKDIEIAREVEGLDLVIAGHQNAYYWSGANADDQQKDQTIQVTQKSGKIVPVVQSYAYNNFLGKVHAKFDASGDISSFTSEPITLDENISQDAESLEKVKSLRAELAARNEEVVGQTAVVLEGETCKVEECNLGNLLADAMNYYRAVRFDGERWTDAAISIIPGGHLLGNIAPANRPADITLGDLMAAVPTESRIVAVTVTGDVLLQVLEHSVSGYSTSNATGQFLQFSGIRVVYDMSRESGSRVVSAIARCWACFVPEYYVIDGWRTYIVMMPASLAAGEYGYTMLVGSTIEELEYDEITVLAEFIGLRSPVYPEVAGRIELRNVQAEEEEGEGEEEGEEVTTADPTTAEPTTAEPTTAEPTTTETPVTEAEPDSATALSSTLAVVFLTTLAFLLS